MEALALADGVIGEDGEPVAGEGTGEGEVAGFAGEAVAGGDDDGGKLLLRRAGLGVRKVKERRYGEVRLGVVEDFFDAEAFGLRGAEDFGGKRSFFREAANEREDLFSDIALTGFGLGAGGDGGDGGTAGGGLFGSDVVEVVGELSAADVGGAVGTVDDARSGRGWGFGTLRYWGGCGCLREKNSGGEKSSGGDEMEGSHRAALIHRNEREVKRWSYQFGPRDTK